MEKRETDGEWYENILDIGERVRWYGRPEQKKAFDSREFSVKLAFALVFALLIKKTVEIIISAIAVNDFKEAIALILAWIFVLVSFYLILLRQFIVIKKAEYVITDKRVISKFGRRIKSVITKPTPPLEIFNVDNKYGNGNLNVGFAFDFLRHGTVNGYPRYYPGWELNTGRGIVLVNIKDPEKIYDIITGKIT